jgi:hypothetical protein
MYVDALSAGRFLPVKAFTSFVKLAQKHCKGPESGALCVFASRAA